MSVAAEITALGEWLREDDSRMQTVSLGTPHQMRSMVTMDFQDFGQAPPGSPFVQWNQWAQGPNGVITVPQTKMSADEASV